MSIIQWRPRLEAFRRQLADAIPCEPPTEEVRADLRVMPLDELVSIYVAWAQRLVRQAPRHVTSGEGFWDGRAQHHRGTIETLITKIEFGEELLPFLSERVRKHGYAPRQTHERVPRGIDWKRMDFVINAYGVHHLHLRRSGSSELLFVDFRRDSADLIMLGDHKSFHDGTLEDRLTRRRAETGTLQLRGVMGLGRSHNAAERTSLARGGITTVAQVGERFVLSSLVASSGASMHSVRHADSIVRTLEEVEERLINGSLAGIIPLAQILELKARKWKWAFDACDLVLIEEESALHWILAAGQT